MLLLAEEQQFQRSVQQKGLSHGYYATTQHNLNPYNCEDEGCLRPRTGVLVLPLTRCRVPSYTDRVGDTECR